MNTSNYPAVVQEIHNEFNLAGEKLLQESLGIIQNAEKVDIHKAARLNSIGFVNNPLITKQKHIEEITKTPKQWAEIVMKYKQKFPLHKFIANHDIGRICEKYNLIRGNVGQYKGFVPEKNLQDIEIFTEKYRKGLKRFHINNITFRYRDVEGRDCKRIEEYVKSNNSTLIGESISSVHRFLSTYLLSDSKYGTVDMQIKSYVELPLYDICAPKKEMILDKKFSLMKGLFETKFVHIPDPIVLYPVEHGAIIITAWGDEASDPLVVNELNN